MGKINENFQDDLRDLLNKHSIDNELDIPDHILAGLTVVYLMSISELIHKSVKASQV